MTESYLRYIGAASEAALLSGGNYFSPGKRENAEILNEQAKCLYESSGFDEISLSSLSISDYSELTKLTDLLLEWTNESKVSLSLPSLRIDSFTKELMDKISTVRTGGLTFAPEAGTQRLRDAINKNVCEDDLMKACRTAFEAGKNSVKLYFMNGLPTETMEDIAGIAELAKKVDREFYKASLRPKGKSPAVTISVSCFVPKPFTSFQWEGQDSLEALVEKQNYLRDCIRGEKHIRYNWHEAKVSRIEAVFARGDRRLGRQLFWKRIGLELSLMDGMSFSAMTNGLKPSHIRESILLFMPIVLLRLMRFFLGISLTAA